MTNIEPTPLPAPTFAGGTKAITLTPVVGTPSREYAEVFVPGEEELADGDAVIARQAQVADQLPPIAGKQRVAYTPVAVPPPEWWAEARISLDEPRASD
jgi:hypothetical protein